MKKRIIALLAAVMVLGSTTTVLAASPDAPGTNAEVVDTKENVTGATVNGAKVDLTEVEDVKAIAAVTNVASVNKVLGLVDVNVQGKATVTFNLKGATVGKKIAVYHWDGKAWGLVTTVTITEAGKLTATFEDLSPVMFVDVTTAQEGGNNGGSTGGSPNTGAVAVLPLVAVAGLAGAAVCAKKSR